MNKKFWLKVLAFVLAYAVGVALGIAVIRFAKEVVIAMACAFGGWG